MIKLLISILLIIYQPVIVYSLPVNQLIDRFVNASKEYKENDIWLRGVDIVNSNPFFPANTVFSNKDYRENIACFRIPSIVNSDSKIMIFTEARLFNCSDCSQKGIVTKTSKDNGVTWSDWKWVVPPGQVSANPTSVYDNYSKKIILHYATGKTNISGKLDCVPSSDNWQLESYDFGKTWSEPYNISKYLGVHRGLLPGPGNAYQLESNGRIIIPGHFGTAERTYGHVITYYSDNFGKTWNTSNNIFPFQDEATISIIEDDILILNMRNGHNNNSCKCRSISKSYNNGLDWTPIEYDPSLKDPICQGTSTTINKTYFFINPNMYYSRSNLTIHYKSKISDEWRKLRVTDEFSFTGYSGLTNKPIKTNGNQYLGVIWTSCDLSLPFRVWCSFDDKWKIVFTKIQMNLFR